MRYIYSYLSIIILLAFFMVGGLLTTRANAQLDDICVRQPNAVACRDNAATRNRGAGLYGPNGLLTKVARFIAVIAGISAVALIMYAGMQYITSAGDPSKVQSARDTILFALVGLVVAAIAQSIILFVLNRLPG